MSATPPVLRAAAASLADQAGRVAGALDGVAAACGPGVWEGPAADRFAEDLRQQRSTLTGVADDLRGLARRLYQQADDVERANVSCP